MRSIASALTLLLGTVAFAGEPDTAKEPTSAATRPAESPAAVRAQQHLTAGLGNLDVEFNAKKAEILRRYVAEMTGAKNVALRRRDREEAQRIYDAIQIARLQIVTLVGEPLQDAKIKTDKPFNIRVSDFNGAAGFTKVVEVTPTNIVLRLENDYGKPSKELWRNSLTVDEQSRLLTFVAAFPLQQLRDSYVDHNVFDGFQVSFELQIGSQRPRKIVVGNTRQRDLEGLIEELNAVLPPKYSISSMSR